MTEPIDRNDVLTETEQENRELKERFNKTVQVNLNLLSKIASLEAEVKRLEADLLGDTKHIAELYTQVASLESQLEESRREHRNEIDRREEIISADRDALVVWMQKELNIDLDDLPAVRAMFDTMPPRSVSASEPARSERDTGETEIK